jgi:hypothetical protein
VHIVKILFLTTLAICCAACSERSSQPANTKPAETISSVDPCSLLSKEEVGTVLGQEVSDATVRSSPRPNCQYSVGEGTVTVFVFTDPSAAGGFQAGKTMQDAHTEVVSGVGNEAYWSPDIKTLNVLKGNIYFTVQFYGVSSGSKETMKALAQKVTTRLP